LMMNPVPWLQMTNMISYQGLVRTFPNKLQPGKYKNMGSNSVNIIINTRKIIPPGKAFMLRGGTLNINIPGRSALLLGKTGEPLNYLYL
uniref:hypothetical protein n=1 Tax=Escherichia coli TaxID=562 RepID=UPI002AB80652